MKDLEETVKLHNEGQAGGWLNYRKHLKEYIGEDQAQFQHDMARLLEVQARRKDAVRVEEAVIKRKKNPNAFIPVPKGLPLRERKRINKANERFRKNVSQVRLPRRTSLKAWWEHSSVQPSVPKA